jgi:hypothetical protein
VPEDVLGSVEDATGRDPELVVPGADRPSHDELTDQSDEPEPTRPAEGDETRSDRGPAR